MSYEAFLFELKDLCNKHRVTLDGTNDGYVDIWSTGVNGQPRQRIREIKHESYGLVFELEDASLVPVGNALTVRARDPNAPTSKIIFATQRFSVPPSIDDPWKDDANG